MNQDVTVREPISLFKAQVSKNDQEFRAALPAHISVERFTRVVVTAVINNPALLDADRRSLLECCMKAAQDGLLPDGREGAFIIFGKRIQWMPMIGGILKKIRNSGELLSISAHVAYSNDDFTYELGDDEKIHHRPALEARGKPRLVYAIAKTKDGGTYREIMTVGDIETVRAVSKASNSGPWVTWWDEMARKTVLRRLSKRLPMSSDLEDLVRRDDSLYDMGGPQPRPRVKGLAGKLEALANEDPPLQHHDLQTGEIISEEMAEKAQETAEAMNEDNFAAGIKVVEKEMNRRYENYQKALKDPTGEEAAVQLKEQLDTRATGSQANPGLPILEEAHTIARFGSAAFKKWADRLPAPDYEKIKAHMPALRAEADKARGAQ